MDQNFRFRFDSILAYKEKKEEKAKQIMSEAVKALEEERKKLNDLKIQHEMALERWKQDIKEQQKIYEVQIKSNQIQWLVDMIEIQKNKLTKAEVEVEKCRSLLIEAKKETKKFEKIRENDYESFKAEFKKMEAAQIDQFVSYKSATK
ncbi:flagellar export protein FliJ [Tindallia californiensis]|uniref:Flagellar FliJ protein n=1 Tax=Tindallia californiensis TaxID=159292 RepID=A0A1H3NRX2_9FIRM|nr:flagellar export protein FliJ [Tindallia californiensis]SDY91676.1 flagellar FliJ protein [Tindallia californiensis]